MSRPDGSNQAHAPTWHALVVEDEPDHAAMLQTMLSTAEMDAVIATDGEEALAHAQERVPDLITLDIQMPGESGLMFYRRLKSQDRFRHIPVIVITGLTRDDPEMEVFIHTFLEPEQLPHPETYLEKPVTRDQLLAVVERVLGSEISV